MSTAISIAALAVSALALLVTFAESVARRHAVRAEQADREKQLEILQKSVARTKRAEITASQTNVIRWVFKSDYEFRLTNIGQAFARDVRAVLLEAEGHASLSPTVRVAAPLASGESATVKLSVQHFPRHDPPEVLAFFWSDEEGEQQGGLEVRQHA